MRAAIIAYVIFGFSFLFSKLALGAASVPVLLAARFLLAFLVMNLLLLTRVVRVCFRGKPVWGLLGLGGLQPVCYFLCENYGLQHSTASFSSVLIALIPIVSVLVAAVVLRELPTARQVGFGLLSIAGVILLSLRQSSEGTVDAIGVVLLCGAVLSAVGFNLLSRRTSVTFSAFERTYVMFAIGCAVFVPLALIQNGGSFAPFAQALGNTSFLVAVLYLGAISSVGAFLLVNYANTYLPLSRSTSFANITTTVSVLAGVLLLGDPFDFGSGFYIAMILVGVWGVNRVAHRRHRPLDPERDPLTIPEAKTPEPLC